MFGKLAKGIKFLIGVPTGAVTEITGDALIAAGRGIKWTGDKTEKAGYGVLKGSQYCYALSGMKRDLKEERTKSRMIGLAYASDAEVEMQIPKADVKLALKFLKPGMFTTLCEDVVRQNPDASTDECRKLCLEKAHAIGIEIVHAAEQKNQAEKKEKEIRKEERKQRRKAEKKEAAVEAAKNISDERAAQATTPADTQEVVDAPPATV